jgi:hypothetical protein
MSLASTPHENCHDPHDVVCRALTQPFAYETYQQQRVAKKLEEERASRISVVKKLPRVRGRAG